MTVPVPTHLWLMQDGGGSVATDSVGGFDLVMAEAGASPYSGTQTPGPLGTDGSSTVLNGSRSLWALDTGDLWQPTGDMSIALWGHMLSGGNNDFCGIVSNGGNAINAGWQLLRNDGAGGNVYGTYWTAGGTEGGAGSVVFPIDTTTWHHFVMTRDGTTGDVEFYIDGVTAGSYSTTPGAITWPASPDNFMLGRRLGGFNDYWAGAVAYVAAYNEVIDSTEVARQFAGPGDFVGSVIGGGQITITGGVVTATSPLSIMKGSITIIGGSVQIGSGGTIVTPSLTIDLTMVADTTLDLEVEPIDTPSIDVPVPPWAASV